MNDKPSKTQVHSGVQDLCQKLKIQLDELSAVIVDQSDSKDEQIRRQELMEQLKQQLADLSS